MRIAAVGYRDWALCIYDRLSSETGDEYLIIRSRDEFDEQAIRNFNPNLILFYGWSWVVNKLLVNDFTCVMLHPSPLPKYRGGSPIQNQIIRGETESAVTLFIMDDGMDTGDIIAQEGISLKGSLDLILDTIVQVGFALTKNIIKNGFVQLKQEETNASTYRRLTEKDNEITIKDLKESSAQTLFNKIRMLQSPYPNAFIRCKDGSKLFITSAQLLNE